MFSTQGARAVHKKYIFYHNSNTNSHCTLSGATQHWSTIEEVDSVRRWNMFSATYYLQFPCTPAMYYMHLCSCSSWHSAPPVHPSSRSTFKLRSVHMYPCSHSAATRLITTSKTWHKVGPNTVGAQIWDFLKAAHMLRARWVKQAYYSRWIFCRARWLKQAKGVKPQKSLLAALSCCCGCKRHKEVLRKQ